MTHLQHLVDYLKAVKHDAPYKKSYKQIQKETQFKNLKNSFLNTKHVFLVP